MGAVLGREALLPMGKPTCVSSAIVRNMKSGLLITTLCMISVLPTLTQNGQGMITAHLLVRILRIVVAIGLRGRGNSANLTQMGGRPWTELPNNLVGIIRMSTGFKMRWF